MKRAQFVAALACCLCLGMAHPAAAQDSGPRTYAMMSLIGDSVSILPFNSAITRNVIGMRDASRLDQQQHLSVQLNTPGFDQIALGSVAAALRQSLPGATIDVLQTRDASLYRLQDRLFESPEATRDTREALKATLREHNANYLVIVTRRRTQRGFLPSDAHLLPDANLQMYTARAGGPQNSAYEKLEGIGFYVDESQRVQNVKTLDISNGILVSYIVATMRLVDAKTLAQVAEVPVFQQKVIAVSRPQEVGFNAWDEATEQQKIRSLEEVIELGLTDATHRLLGAAAR
jgi:hypothetical protein